MSRWRALIGKVDPAIHEHCPSRVLSSVAGVNNATDVETPRFASWRGMGVRRSDGVERYIDLVHSSM